LVLTSLILTSLLLVPPFLLAQNKSSQNAPRNKNAQESTSSDTQSGTRGRDVAYQPVPVDEVRRANPVKPTPESIASGKRIFDMDCALCHGSDGVGKTEVSKQMKVPDLTAAATLKGRTDGELVYRIKTGHGEMPGEGDRVKADQLGDVVNYVRSLSGKNEKRLTEEKPAQ
jgi:mono/diheme cytochrome c family protein